MCYCILDFELYMQYHKVERGIIPMKNSDMKVIAIILSIALFFTIVTSNAVSIASVVFLAKGQTATEGTVDASGDATNTDANANTNTNTNTNTGSNAAAPETTAPAGDAGSANTETTAPAGNAGTATPDANANANAPAADNNPIAKDPLAAYQKATKEINTKGIAGYNKIGWQKPLKIEGLGFLDSVIVPILEKFMTTEDEAEVKVNAKGSDDAKNRMPLSNCSKGAVKSATAEKLSNGNYKVVVVMNDQVNPSYADKDGLGVMSREFLDYKDVEKTVVEDPTVSKIVKSLEGQIEYKAYTITSEMTADGKFVSITHYGIGYIKANINGSLNATGELEFNAKYTDFKY